MRETATPYRPTVWLEDRTLCLIDQRELPYRETVLRLGTYPQSIAAIRDMAVRGAGTIGVTGGFAMAQAVLEAPVSGFSSWIENAAAEVRQARPTAKNLAYAVDRVLRAIRGIQNSDEARRRAVQEAQAVHDDDVRMTEKIAQAGAVLLPSAKAVLTHCNAGWLAYAGWGTALAPMYWAHAQGKPVFVYATETRPRGQGARLTTWELTQSGVPTALIADTAAGSILAQGEIGLVIVGADRIAANGDTANKIGTYTLAVVARRHSIPFYVAAPSPTFDADCPSGKEIPIEERDPEEVLEVTGVTPSGRSATVRVATPGVQAKNPAFDVTPAELITGFITECGVIQPVSEEISRFLAQAEASLQARSSATRSSARSAPAS